MLIENYEHLVKSSQNHKNLATTTADKQQQQQQRHDHMSVFLLKLLLTFKHNFHQSQPHRYCSSFRSSIMGVLCVISLSSLLTLCCVDAVGYSYTRFIGPVAGPEHRIYVNDNGGHVHSGAVDHASRLDYVAKPEYEFAYGVEDADAHILHNRNEMRDGDDVKGVYSVVDPDGTLRVVKYTANDANGFQAEVITNGVSSLHGGQQQHHHDMPNNNYHNNYQPQLSGHPSNVYTPNLEQHLNHYYPQNLYPTSKPPPPPTPIIYQYNNNDHYNNNNNNNNDDDVDNGNDYNEEDYQPQYEVHEKQNDKDHKVNKNNNNNDDSGNQNDQHDDDDGAGDADDYENADDDDGGNKKKGKLDNGNKKKKGHNDDNSDDDSDGDDDDDYDDVSEELADYDEAARSNEASDEYY